MFIENLREAVAIKSVSAWPEARGDVQQMADFIQEKLEKVGAVVESCDIGYQTLPNDQQIKLPNVILGTLGNVTKFLFTYCASNRFDLVFRILQKRQFAFMVI